MSYIFPEMLHQLRDFLKLQGFEGGSIKTSRQAAFVAQQIIGSRFKFPPPGSDMTPTLMLIQKEVSGMKKAGAENKTPAFTGIQDDVRLGSSRRNPKAKQVNKQFTPNAKNKGSTPKHLTAFDPAAVMVGYHVFADGACVPNPGPGGWGVVAYKDGEEFYSDCGGDETATNNTMELTAVLRAILWAKQYPTIAITIWTDSQYTCNGVNDWRHGWKARGWQRGGPDAKPENRILMNADLWRAIDEALCDERAANIKVHWVKGHAGHLGNERADELAEIGRAAAAEQEGDLHDTGTLDLDAEYRAVMAG